MDRYVLKDSSWLLGGQSIVKIISFFYTIFLANALGVSDFGLYIVALSYYSLISAVADLGVTRFLVRELAIGHLSKGSLLSTAILTRLSVLSISFAISAIAVYILDPDKLRTSLISLALLAVIPQSISLSLDAVYISASKLKYSALGIVSMTIFTAILGVVLIKSQTGVVGAVIALMIGQLFHAALLAYLCFIHKINCLGVVDLKIIRQLTKGCLPYALLSVLGLLYFKIDSLLIVYLRGSFDAGIYGVAYKFLEAAVLIPSVLSIVLFPILSKIHKEHPQELKKVFIKVFKIMGAFSLIVVSGFLLILPPFIHHLLPNYTSAIPAVKVLALTIPFIFLYVPLSQILLSCEKYLKQMIFISLITISFNILLNLHFIPQYGFIAAAWITVLSDGLSLLSVLALIYKVFSRKV